MKFDPHRSEEYYKNWRKKGDFEGLSKKNTELLLTYLDDMEVGANVSSVSKKGARSYIRLRNLKSKVHSWALIIQKELGITDLTEMKDKERELMIIIKRMREGEIKGRRLRNKPITAPGTYVKAFKAFWHWHQRVQRKKGIDIPDITIDLDGRDAKPKFNYFTIEDLNKLCNKASYDYRIMMMFLFDSGIRAPTELMNTRVKDLEWNAKDNHYTLNIREEVSKTFGRRIKLLLCSNMLKDYIKNNKLEEDEYIFTKTPQMVNQYLKNLANKVLGIGILKSVNKTTKYKQIENGLTMYDFRHASACYWLPRYKSESALKYRFGWKKSDMIHYYTELLGMKDTIQEEDLFVDVSKTELERQLQEKGNEISLLQEQLKNQDVKITEIFEVMKNLDLDKFIGRGITSSEILN